MTEPTFKLSRVSGAPVSDDELIADLQRVAQSLNSITVPQKKYGALGTFDYSTALADLAHGIMPFVSLVFPYPTKLIFPTSVYSRTYLFFGSI